MPLLKRKPFSLLEPPSDLEPHELVFQVRFTKEIFRDYQEYLKRINLYRQRSWTCKITGKSNMTYEEALVSEQRAAEKAQRFPEEFIEPVLRIVQYSMLTLSSLINKIKSDLQERLVEGLELYGKKEGNVQLCKIVKALDKKADELQYEVAWLDRDGKPETTSVVAKDYLICKKLPFGREVLKSFIRESTYQSSPFVIHSSLAVKYGIPTDPPEDLNGQISFLNGCIVYDKKRKKNEEGNGGQLKRSKQQEGLNGPTSDIGVQNGKESIKYPIEDQLVRPGPDDPVFTSRPSPTRDFSIQTDSVGDLLMVWDFCSSFGRLLYLLPYSLEDFEKAVCHKDNNVALIVETHAALLRLLLKDEGEYFLFSQKKKRNSKITLVTWTEHLCDFVEMIGISDLTTHISTIKRGHYGLLDAHIKLAILKELVDQAVATNRVREKLDEYLEQRTELFASKREEALEEGKKKREAKERLRAVSEASGTTLELNSDTGGDPSNIPLNNGESLENGTISKSHQNLLPNGDSEQEGTERQEKTKKLLKELEKCKEQRKEYLEKEMEKRVIRTNPLGKDRLYNRYWFFRRDGRVFVESRDSKQWGYYSNKEEVDALMSCLNPKGVRERALKMQLEKHYSKITKELQKRSREIAYNVALEEAVVRRSTRVRAPPKDNPALSFLKYINKWKVLVP